ncbi:MAG: anti-sigma regulatory factor [bacterium]|nr:anti-sigma regulatory factor [bacterium]
MTPETIFKQEFKIKGGDFINGGDASCEIGTILKEVGVDPDIILHITVAAYEAEMNAVIYARSGTMDFRVYADKVVLKIEDEGRGIENIKLAMQEGFSTATDEIREMGFGAGMGLPNIKKNADIFNIDSIPGQGTRLELIFNLPGKG